MTGGETLLLLDPTAEGAVEPRSRAPRLASLEGKRVALLDISKPRGDVFLDEMATLLAERGATIERHRKPTFTKPAPARLLEEVLASADAVVEALAD